jgi:phosphoesterase RecJ-like protein
MKLLGKTLSGIRIVANGNIAYVSVRRSDFKKAKAKPADCENFVNFARSIKGVHAALFLREDLKKRNTFHASFRSKGKVDVNRVASHFGGGGHKNAAGCVLRGSFESVKARVLKRLSDEL